MQFTDEVNWDIMDFLIAGFLLFSLGLILSFIIKKFHKSNYKIVLSVFIIVFIFLLVWAELAVGIFGTPFAGS